MRRLPRILTIAALVLVWLGGGLSILLGEGLSAQDVLRGYEYLAKIPVSVSLNKGTSILVVDEKGAPIRGADVIVTPNTWSPPPDFEDRYQAWLKEKRRTLSSQALTQAIRKTWWSRYQTDGDGRAVVPSGEKTHRVFAVYKDRCTSTHALGKTPLRILWRKAMEVSVLALDPKGNPVRGLPLRVETAPDNWADLINPSYVCTDKEGRATLPIPRALDEYKQLFVDGMAITKKPTRVAFSLHELRAKRDKLSPPLHFLMPSYGQVRVQSRDALGDLTARLVSAQLEFGDTPPAFGEPELVPVGCRIIEATTIEARAVTFDFVEVGCELTAHLRLRDTARPFELPATGPSIHGEKITLACDELFPAAALDMRVLALDGKPLVDCTLFASFNAKDKRFVAKVKTNAEAKLRIFVPQGFEMGHMLLIRRGDKENIYTPTQYLGSFQLPQVGVDRLKRRLRDLGNIRLQPEQVLVSGRIVDPMGIPIANAAVTGDSYLDSLGDSWGSGDLFQDHLWHHTFTGRDGRFVLRENGIFPTRLKLRVSADRFVLPDLEVTVPSRKNDAVITLVAAPHVRGRLLSFPDAIQTWPGTVRLRAEDSPGSTWSAGHTCTMRREHFLFYRIPVGKYQLGLFGQSTDNPLLELSGIEVKADGSVMAEGIDAIDWRPLGRLVRFEAVTKEGKHLHEAGAVQFRNLGGAELAGISLEPSSGFFTTLLAEESSIMLSCDKYQRQWMGADFTGGPVIMEPKPRVRIQLRGLPALKGYFLRPFLDFAGTEDTSLRLPVADSYLSYRSGCVDILVPGPGKYVLRLSRRGLENTARDDGDKETLPEWLSLIEFDVTSESKELTFWHELTPYEQDVLKTWAKPHISRKK